MEESLTFYTKNVAYQLFREQERGALEIGMKADFLVLSENPLTIDPSEVIEIVIKSIYQDGLRIR
jgi:predicted amidohydrolase YtcJ